MRRDGYLLTLFGVWWLLWSLLAISPVDRDTWWLENVLLLGSVATLFFTRRSLPLSTPSYTLLFLFLCLHTVGAHYTYSLVPFGDAFNEAFGWQRNHFDRFVHLSYGLALALPLRELLMLHAGVRGFWSYFLPIDLVASSSLLYELVEWAAAIVYGGNLGAAFLGTQGDEWDAHRDMALAGAGAVIAIGIVMIGNRLRGKDLTLEWLSRLPKHPSASESAPGSGEIGP